MSDSALFDAVALKTGEDAREIRHRGFMLVGPEESSSDIDPECMLDLIDLPEAGTVDWDALGFSCREPFYKSTLKARLKKKKRAKTSVKKQLARAA